MNDDSDAPDQTALRKDLHTMCVEPSQAGIRLDKWLSEIIQDLSRARARTLIDAALVLRNGVPEMSASRKIAAGECYEATVPEAIDPDPEPEDIPLTILYEDEHLIVIDKPAGLVVHPAPGSRSGTLVNALLHHCAGRLSGINGVRRPGIVHRLDKDTSGIMVVAKTDGAHRGLAEQFALHSLSRAYLALCWGAPIAKEGEIEGQIGRNPHDRKKMAVLQGGGKYAKTRFKVMKRFAQAASLIECRLMTGRTHQIRVHMTSIGHPLVGDPVYGSPPRSSLKWLAPEQSEALIAFPRQALHAYELGFIHPANGERLLFNTKIPNDINKLIATLDNI